MDSEAHQTIAIRARMTQHALHHPEGLDLRTAIVLWKNGVLRGPIQTFRPSDGLLELVREQGHPDRLQSPNGPLIAQREGETVNVLAVADFLYADDAGFRQIAADCLEGLAAAELGMLTRRTQEVIARERPLLVSDGAQWQVAAAKVHDAVGDDYLYNLAAYRQCIALGYREGAETFGPQVLRPTLTALTALEFATDAPSKEHEKIGIALRRLAHESPTIERLCQEWYRRFGHLPLAAHLSLGKALEEWRTLHGGAGSPWEAVWQWADRTEGPLARYHACQAFVASPGLIPGDKREDLWREMLEIVTAPRPKEPELKWSKAWRLRSELLSYYAAYFECVAPGEDSERTANLAFWAAERVAAIYETAHAPLDRVVEKVIAPNAELTREVWQLTRPPVQPSALRFAALFTSSPWALGLLSELGDNVIQFVPDGTTPEVRESIRETLLVDLIQAFPLSRSTAMPTYAFEPTVEPAAVAWSRVAEAEGAESLRQMVACNQHLADPAHFISELRGIAKSSEGSQIMIARAFRTFAYLGTLPLEPVRELLWEPAWRREVIAGLSEQALNAFWDGVAELQMQHRGEWSSTLPHFWASLCIEGVTEDRRRLLFALTALSCLSAGSTSALRRLLQDPQKRFAEDCSTWRGRCEDAVRFAPPWPAAKLRAFVAELGIP